jgi:RimJ/RimL family protein N-acetyltransferase
VDGLLMRRARPDEGPRVLDVLDAAARRLTDRGIPGWPTAFRPEWVEPGLSEGKVWLAERDGVAVATLTLYWSDVLWADDARAGYLHRFATRSAGRGLGSTLLRWTVATVRARGRDRLRLDCATGNRALRAYYERAGFVHRGDLLLDPGAVRWSDHRPTVSRYELTCEPTGQVQEGALHALCGPEGGLPELRGSGRWPS